MDVPKRAAITDLDWLVMSLARTPDQLAKFQADNGHLGLPIEIVEATDGLEVNRAELAELDLIIPDHMGGWSDSTIGNALSHWLCWYQVVDTQRPTCIFDDRAFLRHDFVPRVLGLLEALPADWDMVQLGFNTDSIIEIAISPDCHYRGSFAGGYSTADDMEKFARVATAVAPMRLYNSFGTFAYLVTPAGAQKLIDSCFPLAAYPVPAPMLKRQITAGNIDGMVNRNYSSMQAYVCFPPIALHARQKATSAQVVETPPVTG